MSLLLQVAIAFYCGINIFVTGQVFERYWEDSDTVQKKVVTIITCLVTLAAYVPITFGSTAIDCIKWLSDYFQIETFFRFHFTDKWKRELPKDEYENIIQRLAEHKARRKENILRYRIYNGWVDKITASLKYYNREIC